MVPVKIVPFKHRYRERVLKKHMLNKFTHLTGNLKIAIIGGIGVVLLVGLFVALPNLMAFASAKSTTSVHTNTTSQYTTSNTNGAGKTTSQANGTTQQGMTGMTATTTTTTTNQTQTQQQTGGDQQGQQQGDDPGKTAVVNLRHTPTGSATLHYDAQGQRLIVTIMLIGLAPNSTHPAHIHAGTCAQPAATSNVVFVLNALKANSKGQVSTTTIIPNVLKGIPATGWYINVHNGPTMTTADQDTPITCGDIVNPNQAASVLLFMGPPATVDGQITNEQATGFATVKLVSPNNGNQGQLIVTINVQGLVPNSVHATHIHAGSCFNTGKMLYALTPLQADNQGNINQTVTINNVKEHAISATGWVINMHFSTLLGTQTGYNPILCGEVVPD
jgi:hypothetical protein